MKALILIDLINDMVDREGRLAGKGYFDHAESRGVPAAVAQWRDRADIDHVVHVGLRFRTDYADAPRESLLLGRVAEFGVAKEGEAGADFVPWATPQPSDVCIKKIRISPFFGTELDAILRSLGVDTVVIGGVATDLAVSSAARDAHDRGYSVEVAASICVAANEEDHSSALATLKKLATVHE